ncbi:MAG: hypothetical protein GWM93_04135, partial [Gemmatimonadetes bacterium]|nr:hypothetical protein [Gemmatimonadota bacterium]NIT65873.1 hypothetical protein [Gemmatimonadota bacterium]NIW74332.1 hypothetical protein [Gemmatimonadota bacterium]NIY34451.1 hypothetical protein [Gemmatimonadota bacterium]NIY42718.1 hypothetical protein [Gemmatimonadota bacterium]
MRGSRLSWWPAAVAAAVLLRPGDATGQFNDPPAPAAYALQGVTVVTADGRRSDGVTLVVRDGRIQALGPNVTVPADARVLEGDSLVVYPGFVDADGEAGYEFPELDVDRSQV